MPKKFTARYIHLKGDPKSPEPAQHIITFPGGSIEVSRTEDDEYWVHVAVHKKQLTPDIPSQSKRGTIVDSRIDSHDPMLPIAKIDPASLDKIEHLAVRITTRHPKPGELI